MADMSVHFTQQAQRIMDKLSWLGIVLFAASGDNAGFNQRLSEELELRKVKALADLKAMVLPHLRPGERWEDKVSYDAEDPRMENQGYTDQLERMLGEFGICRAIDLYHCYLRRVLELALTREPSRIRDWAAALKLGPEEVAAIELNLSKPKTVYNLFRKNEGIWRKLVHDFLGVFEPPELAVFVEVRNRLVHDLGEDREGRIARLVTTDLRWMPKLVDGFVEANSDDGYQAVATMCQDIQIMDFQLAAFYSLPTTAYEQPKIRRVYS